MSGFLKNLSKHSLIMVYTLIISACINSSAIEQNHFDENGMGNNLTSTILKVDSIQVGARCDYVIGNKFIFICIGTPHRYEIYTIKGDSLVFEKNFLNIGRGPYEMNNPCFQYDPENNRMYLFSRDNQDDKLFIVDLKDFNNVYNPSKWEKKRIPTMYTRGELGILSDTVFLNQNYTRTSNMFSLSYASNKDNDFRCLEFKYPGEHPDLSLQGQNYLFMGRLKQNPGALTFVYSCYFSQYMFIFDVVNEQIENIRYISKVLPIYKPTNDLYNPIAIADEYKQGFDKFQVTQKYIYIGYNNVTWGQIRNSVPFKGYSNSYFDRINVFDWDGNFVKRLVLDKPVVFFSVSQDDSYLYASSVDLNHENQPDQVLRFKL